VELRKVETEIRLWLKWVGHLLYASSFQNLVYEQEIEVPVVALMQAAARHVSQWCVFSVFHHCTRHTTRTRVSNGPKPRLTSWVASRTNKLNGLFLSWVADPKMREKMTQLMALTRPRRQTAEQPGMARNSFVFILFILFILFI
jgi:hypothetical protein